MANKFWEFLSQDLSTILPNHNNENDIYNNLELFNICEEHFNEQLEQVIRKHFQIVCMR